MPILLIENKIFDKVNFTQTPLLIAEYENCTFTNCNFQETVLSDMKFTSCTFTGCNLSLAKLTNTGIRECIFTNCKMLGLHFDSCNQFNISFTLDNCTVNHSSFYTVKLKKSIFKNSQFHEVDFTECDLSGAVLDNCDLNGAKFENTVLEKTDLRTALRYSIDPETNRINKAKFSTNGVAGLLHKYDIEIE